MIRSAIVGDKTATGCLEDKPTNSNIDYWVSRQENKYACWLEENCLSVRKRQIHV